MAIPMKQAIAVGRYILKHKLLRTERFPLVTMLEPLFRCNLECIGCGKIQYPEEVLRRTLTPEQCFAAVEECGAPVVTVAGGEPLIHPQIGAIARGLVERKKFVYLCTNALLLRRKLHLFEPSDHLTLSIHLDGLERHHDACVSRAGTYDTAVASIKEALQRGFRVTTNTTVFEGHPPEDLHRFFDEMTKLGVDGMMISPGYSYEKAPVQDKFLKRKQTKELFAKVLEPARRKKWVFNHSPFYLEFLEGTRDYQCTPWGNPNYTIFGWQRPCYLLSEGGYVATFKELMETTDWSKYGVSSGNPKCQDCMVHCGYEPTAVADSLSSPRKIIRSIASAVR